MTVQRLHVSNRFSEVAIAGNLVHLAGQLASEELVYQSNSHASKEYRMEMVKAMVQRLAKEVAQ